MPAVHGQHVCSDQYRSDKLLVFIVHGLWTKVEDDGAYWSDKLVSALLANVRELTDVEGAFFLQVYQCVPLRITHSCNLATRWMQWHL